MAGAIQLVLQTDLSTSHSFIPLLAGDSSSAYLNGAKEVLRATVTRRANRLYVQAAVIDNSTQKNEKDFGIQGAGSSGILPLLNELAKRVDSRASAFSTANSRALQQFVRAAQSPKAQERVDVLTGAISIDPSFGLAYLALADAAAQAAPKALPGLLQAGASHKAEFTPFDRVRFNALQARYLHAPLPQQEAAFRAILQIAPNDSDALAAVGSLSFLRGDSAEGTRYLQQALQLNAGNANLKRAMADGLIETRHFAEAEKLLVSMDNNAAILPELAICVLLEGDVTRANTIAERFFASISNPDAKTLFRAVWLKLSGHSDQAVQLLTSAGFEQPAIHAIAYSELAVWQMMANDFAAARESAVKARQFDPRPGSFGSLAAILAAADGPVEAWKSSVNESFLANNEAAKNSLLGYGLFLGGHFADAAQFWATALQQSGDIDLRARAMLAASLIREGKADQARQINVQPFAPDFADLYGSVSFLEMNRRLGIGVR
jgi:Flp pilus assembly protein TadD